MTIAAFDAEHLGGYEGEVVVSSGLGPLAGIYTMTASVPHIKLCFGLHCMSARRYELYCITSRLGNTKPDKNGPCQCIVE